MKRDTIDFLEDILDNIEKANAFLRGMSYEEFCKDDKTIYAVIRSIEIIGEAVIKIPEDVKKSYPEIPWKGMSGMRNKVIHEYFGVDLEVVWETVQERIPKVKPLFQKILDNIKR